MMLGRTKIVLKCLSLTFSTLLVCSGGVACAHVLQSKHDEQSNYKGSQADNHGLQGLDLSVNPATGALKAALPLLKTWGYIPLDIKALYSAGSVGDLGLPDQWQLSIDYVVPGQSVTISGQTYVPDADWTDAQGDHSGLKYLNQAGIYFIDEAESLALPASYVRHVSDSDQEYYYQYKLTLLDGSHEYFDPTGKLIAQDDRFGNYVLYAYGDPEAGVQGNSVESIQDSLGQVHVFTYGDHTLSLSGIDHDVKEHTRTLTWNQLDMMYTDPLGLITTLYYSAEVHNGQQVIDNVIYPNGQERWITYQDVPYFYNDNGNVERDNFNAVSTIDTFASSAPSTILNETHYNFGLRTDNYFTGYPNGHVIMTPYGDSLFESGDDYEYDVLVTHVNFNTSTGAVLNRRKVDTTYNAMSVPVEQDVYRDDESYPIFKTVYTYDLAAQADTTVNYNKPITTTREVLLSEESGTYRVLSKLTNDYDDYGHTTSAIKQEYQPLTDSLLTVKKTSSTYDTEHNNLLLNQTTDTWNPLTQVFDVKHTSNTLNTEHTTIVSSAVSTGTSSDANALTPWKDNHYTYNIHGQQTSNTIAWAEDAPAHQGVDSADTHTAYTYDLDHHTLTLIATNAIGNQTAKVIDLTTGKLLETGQVVSTTPSLQLTHTKTYTYDADGRQASVTDAEGHTTTYTYQDAQNSGGVNTVTETFPATINGNLKVTLYTNALNQPIKVTANSNALDANTMITQAEHTYDSWGDVLTQTDALGHVITETYNSLGMETSQTDEDGNVRAITYDYGALSSTETFNGVLEKTTIDNLNQHPVETIQYANSDNNAYPVSYDIETRYQYDGQQQQVSTATYELAGHTTSELHHLTTTYDPDGNKVQTVFSQGDSTRTIDSTFDVLGDLLSKEKVVHYSQDGHSTDETIARNHFTYNAAKELTQITDAQGHTIHYTYTASGKVQTKTLKDGTVFTNTYDGNNHLLSQSWSDAYGAHELTNTYNALGKLATQTLDGQTLAISYDRPGHEVVLTYPNGSTLVRHYNEYGQLTSFSDANLVKTVYTYRDQGPGTEDGKLSTVTQNGHVIQYHYSTEATPNDNKQYGALISKSNDVYTRYYHVDALGRLATQEDSTAAGEVLLKERYSYDPNSLLLTVTASSTAEPDDTHLNYENSNQYDDFNQLVAQKHQTALGTRILSYEYDGNGNVVSEDNNGTQQTYTYNDLDQLTAYTSANQTNQPTYDSNGNVSFDGSEQSYHYNALNQMVENIPETTGDTLAYTYYANGQLSQRADLSQDEIVHYYYLRQHIVAIDNPQQDRETSFLLDNDQRLMGTTEENGQPSTLYYLSGVNGIAGTFALESDKGVVFQGSADYTPYGIVMGDLGTTVQTQFVFNGEYGDVQNNLVAMDGRYYDPQLHQYTSPSQDSQAFNQYRLAVSHVVKAFDNLLTQPQVSALANHKPLYTPETQDEEDTEDVDTTQVAPQDDSSVPLWLPISGAGLLTGIGLGVWKYFSGGSEDRLGDSVIFKGQFADDYSFYRKIDRLYPYNARNRDGWFLRKSKGNRSRGMADPEKSQLVEKDKSVSFNSESKGSVEYSSEDVAEDIAEDVAEDVAEGVAEGVPVVAAF